MYLGALLRQQTLAQDIQERKASALLDITGAVLDIACPLLDSHQVLVVLALLLPLLLHSHKDFHQLS